MLIYFRTTKLQKTCSQEQKMIKELGGAMARKLRQRLTELKAADSLSDISHLPPPRCHELTGKRAGQFSVDLEHPYRLLFIPADEPGSAQAGRRNRSDAGERNRNHRN